MYKPDDSLSSVALAKTERQNRDAMLEMFQNFEQAATKLAPLTLIVPGLAAIIVGLFIWLGGLGFRRLLIAIVGAVSGGFGGYFLVGQNIITAVVIAGIAALIAMIFEKLFFIILAGGLVAVFAFAFFAGPYIEDLIEESPANQDSISDKETTATIRQSVEMIKEYAIDSINRIKQARSQMPLYKWAIIAVLAILLIAGSFWIWRLASALCCSALGTLLIFAGMILLLLYKGSAPITKIVARTQFYGTVFIGMTAFGTLEQLLLCRYEERKAKRKRRADKNKQEPEKAKRDWRTS